MATEFKVIEAALEQFELYHKEILEVTIAYRVSATKELVHLHYDGEKMMPSGFKQRLEYLGVTDTSSAKAICNQLGIQVYPIKGHCLEQSMVQAYGPDCLTKYFVSWDTDSVLASCFNDLSEKSALCEMFDDEAIGYEAIVNELKEFKFI